MSWKGVADADWLAGTKAWRHRQRCHSAIDQSFRVGASVPALEAECHVDALPDDHDGDPAANPKLGGCQYVSVPEREAYFIPWAH